MSKRSRGRKRGKESRMGEGTIVCRVGDERKGGFIKTLFKGAVIVNLVC